MLSTRTQELPLKKTKEKKGTLHASLVTGDDENQREGSGAGSAALCEALGLLPVSMEAQQVPATSPRWEGAPSSASGPRTHCSFSLHAVSPSS